MGISDYSLDELRLAISLAIIGQQFLLAVVFLKGRPIAPAQWYGALLLLGAICYLIQSNPLLREASAPIRPIVAALSIAVPYMLWEFSIAVFETEITPRSVRYSMYVVPVALWFVVVSDFGRASVIGAILEVMHQFVGLTAIALTITSIYISRGDDLVESRRRYRTFFVLFIALQCGAVIVFEMAFGYANLPDWLELTNVTMIGILTLGLTLPLLAMDGSILWHEVKRHESATEQPTPDALSPANQVLHESLNTAMDDGFYRTAGLGIGDLADELNVPEHQLRKLVNQNLGYRNFISFLNHHRIREAKSHLSSAETVRVPILTIAMDLGYGSIGPFNRAFKEATGITPSEYRREYFGKQAVDSE